MTAKTLTSVSHSLHANSTAVSDAWLLQYAPSRYIALPLTACQELVDSPDILPIPATQDYALGMIQWRDQWLPLLDLHSLLCNTGTAQHSDTAHYLIVAYYTTDAQVAYVALSLPYFPYLLQISDSALCALPNDNPIWADIADSCIRFQDHRVPIVDSSHLFNRTA